MTAIKRIKGTLVMITATALFCFSHPVWAQSPGGVSTSLNLWLKGDNGPENAGALPAANGESIVTWRDRSGAANDYVAVAGPTLVTGLLNNNPAVQILSGGFDAPAGAALGTNWTTFFVSKKRASDNNGRVFDGSTSNYLWAHWGNFTNSIYINGNPSNFNSGIATTTGITNLHLHAYRRESVGGTLEARADGTSLTTFGSSNSASGIRIDINQGNFSASESSHADIGEVIIFNSALSSAEIQRVESYLAIKYGLTIAHDYLASNGTVIWNFAGNSGFNTDITAIGRDDNSALSQTVSTSINAGADATLTSAGFGTDLSFLVLGNNGASNGTSTDVPVGYARRINKIWKAAVSGLPGSAAISFDLTDLGLPVGLTPASYELLINNSGSFGTVTSTVAGFSVANSVVTFNNVTLADGDFVTIAAVAGSLSAPAGITDNLKLWLKADAGVSGSAPITSWTDQAGNGFVATAPGNAPDLLTNQLNGNPVVDFASTNSEYLSIANGIFGTSAYANAWVYAVSKADAIQNQTLFYEALAGGETFNGLVPWSNANIYYDFGQTGGTGRINGAWGGSTSSYDFWTMGASTGTATPNGTQRTIYRDGAVILSNANGDSGAGNNQPFLIGGGYNTGVGTSNPFDGKIAEMIVYTGVPTELEQEKIQSYLAVKYGITKNSLDIAGTAAQDERDYFSSAGSVIWDYSANATYHNNVAGIGRDDASSLDQRQSRSINSGADVTMDKGGAFPTDLGFIVWGDNNAANGTSTDTPGGYAKRLNKVWRANVSGAPGAVSFSIDLTDLGLPIGLSPTDYALLIDNDGTFNAGATIHTTGAAIGSAQLSFTNVTLADGDYFTIAVASTALRGPANITDNLKLWLKADAGVAGTAPITSWTDQAGNGYVATAPGNAPDLLTNQINGNPVIDFTSASSEYLSVTSGLFGSSTYNDTWAYVVHKADAIQNNTLFYELTAGTEHYSTLLPWSDSNIYFDYANGGAGRLNGAWGGSINSYNLWTLGSSTGTTTPNGTRKTISRDGLVILSNNNSDNTTGNNQPFLIGGGYNTGVGTSNPFDGKIAEMIVYTGVPTELEQEKIQSYLAVKYGITKNSLDIAGTAAQDERDYFSSAGSVIWDYSANSAYHNRVAGIGRDDASQLLQLNSRSIGAGSIVTLSTGSLAVDNSFVIVGDDNGALVTTATGVPTPYTRRPTRIWRADGAGTPGTVSVSFDLTTGLHNSGIASDYALLIKGGSTDFSTGATVHTTGASIVNNTLTFTGVSLSPGDNFTLGIMVTTPGSLTPVFWVKANEGVTGTTDVSLWADQSGNGNNAAQATLANQPSLISSDINNNPTVHFSGSTDIMSPTAAPANLNSTIFTVAIPNVNTSWRTMFRGSVNDHPLIIENGGNRLGYYDNDNVGFKASGFTWLQNEPALVGVEMRAGDVNFRKNGTQGSSLATIDLTGVSLNFFGNYQGNGQPFGRIAETMIFNGSALTTTEKERIESYLGIKYGISLPHNYFSSASATIWDATTNAAYSNRITGIGRDDGFALDQRKSKSIHSGAIVTLEKTTPASSFGTDASYVLIGDDNTAVGSTTTNVHPSYTTRVTRIWKTSVSGSPGTMTVSFDLGNGVYNTGNAADYAIIINNGSATFAGSSAHTTGASINSGVLSFTGVTLNNNDFFTLAFIRVPGPGGLVDGLRQWVRADAGVTGATDVSTWADQSGVDNNLTQATVANQPNYTASDVNFKPSIHFSGATENMAPVTAPANLNTTVFMVGVPNVNSSWRTMFRGTTNDHPIIVESGGTRLGYYDGDNVGFKPSGFTWLQNEAALVSLEMRTGDVNFRKNGSQGASINTVDLTGLSLNSYGNYTTNAQPFGRVSEVLVYSTSTALTTLEKERIESYLAIKYGVNLPHNYYNSSSAVLWDVSANATYSNRIMGLGRDFYSSLDHRKSKSVSSSSVLTIEKTTPASPFGTDLDYLLVGDDNGLLGATVSNLHPSYPMRVSRIWRTEVQGSPGTVTLSFDLGSGIYNSGNAGDYAVILKGGDTNFTTGATAHSTGASLVAGVLTFTNVPLVDDTYFTLALPRIASPGGAIDNLRLWMRADAGVTGGAIVSTWADQTSYYYSATQGTAANQPSVLTSRVNFNPAIQFDGSNDQLNVVGGIMGTSTYNDINVFVVSRVNTVQNSSVFFETQASGGRISAHIPWSDNNIYWDAGSASATQRQLVNWGGSVNTNYIWSLLASTSSTALGANQNIVRNGRSLASDATMGTFTGNGSTLTLGVNASSNFFNGEVSEVITYTGALSANQYSRIQSYLALKYGITLDQTSATNYVASNNAVIWDATGNSTYRFDVAGIGRDDASALSQPKSKSINTGAIVTIDKGGAFSNDLDFIVWGNDNAYNSPTTVGRHPSYPYRLGKTWRADVSGTPGTVSVSFDLSNGIYNTGNPADYALLIHTSSDFTGGTAHTTGAAFNGTDITFTGVTLNDGDYFTLGMPTPPAPGGVVNNMGIWFKADLGVSGVATASAWADQSGNNLNVSQSTAGNQPAIVTNRHNFNPSIQFDGTNDNLSVTSGFLGSNTLTDTYAFTVSRTNTITASYVFFESATGGQYSLRAPWSDNILYWEPGNTGVNRVSANTWSGTTGAPFLWALNASTTATPTGQRQDIIRNGFNLASDASMNAFTGSSSPLFLGSGSGGSYYNGEISELVIYRGALTGTMTQQIQSYMALKYGITLTGMDYLNSAGTTVFSTTTTQSAYARDIAGIGRDDNSALSQLKSKSVNTPNDLVAIAKGDFITPTSFTTNHEYLIWGHNGQPVVADPLVPSITHNGSTIVRQLLRVWSTQKTGAPTGNAIIEIDMNLVIGPSGLGTNNTNDVRLLIDNDATFGNASAGEITLTASSVSGGRMYFTVPFASISTGQGFFTVGSVNATTAPLTTPAPGGVVGDMRLWLKADAGVTGSAPVTAWADQSPNGFVAAAVGNSPDLLLNQINNNPSVDFTRASSEYLRVANGLLGSSTYNDMWTYAVMQGDLLTDNTLVYEAMAGGETFNILLPWSNANIYLDYGVTGGTGRLNGAWGGTLGAYNMWTVGSSTSTATPNGTRKTISRDGAVILSNNNNDGVTGGNQPFLIGGGYNSGVGTSNPMDGKIAELIVFGEIPTPLEQEKVQSYLAIKYGISKNSADVAATVGQDERDYFASDGTIIWDYSANAPYNNKIAGIGRDDLSALVQRKSQNISAPSYVSIDKAGAFSNDKDFVMWGSDNGFLGLTTTGAHASLTYRLGRVWKADLSGTPGSVTVGFDLTSGIYNSGNAADYRLLYGNSASNFSGATAVVGTFVGNVITFTGITFNDGDFFTLGVANMPAPGGVVPNMHYWVKSDAGLSGPSNASAWADQSGNAFTVTQTTVANQPAIVSNRSNFNPTVQFDGANDQLLLAGGTVGTNTFTDINVIMIARVNTVTASSAFFETQAAGGRINVHLPWSDNIVYWDAGGTGANQRLSGAWGGAVATNYLWSFGASTTATASGARQDIYRNGRRIFFDNNMTAFTGNNSQFSLGSGGGGSYFNGEIGEAVFYRGPLSASQLQRIHSYLAIKHGITLDQTAATSYYASDWNGTTGTIVWDASAAGTYRTDIAAIGRDDNSALSQKQSASVNAGNVLTIGNTSIDADNASNPNSFSVDRSFFSWGHNNLVMDAQNVNDRGTTTNGEVIETRLARVWFAKETGTVGTLKVRFDLSAVMGAGGVVGNNELANVRLLVDADGTFATGSTSISPSAFNNTTDIVEFDHNFAAGTGFYFTVASVNRTNAPLPIELLNFDAKATSKGTLVQWATSSEFNNDYFEVLVSKDEATWASIARVKGHGTTQVQNNYEWLDEVPLSGKSYYRLKQVDFDEKVTYSSTVAVDYDHLAVELFPNPANRTVNVSVSDDHGTIQKVTISSLQGITALTVAFTPSNARNQQAIDISGLSAGVYLVNVECTEKVVNTRLVVIR